MNTFQLACFLKVAETLNFARAAERLSVTQPAVTHQIRSLEEELGVKLFRRSTRLVELTREGLLFTSDARTIMETAARARARFEAPEKEAVVAFAVGCQSHAYLSGLSGVLRELKEKYPGLHPRFQTGPAPHIHRLLKEGEVEVVLDFRESGTGKGAEVYRELLKVPLVCLCSRENPLAGQKSVSLEDLKKEKLIFSNPVRNPEAVLRVQELLMRGRSIEDIYFGDSPETALLLARAGYGVSFLPRLFLPEDPLLAQVPVEGAGEMSFGICVRPGEESRVVKDFIRIARSQAGSLETERQRETGGGF